MKRVQTIAGLIIGLVLVASFVAYLFFLQSAEKVARNHCAKQGIQVEKVLSNNKRFGNRNRRTVVLQVKEAGQTPVKRKVVVELLRLSSVLPWQVLDVREQVQQ